MLGLNWFKQWVTPLELLKHLTVSRSCLTLSFPEPLFSWVLHHRDVSPSVVKVRTVKKGSEKIISSEEICF